MSSKSGLTQMIANMALESLSSTNICLHSNLNFESDITLLVGWSVRRDEFNVWQCQGLSSRPRASKLSTLSLEPQCIIHTVLLLIYAFALV